MEIKDKIELLSKQIEVIHKKLLILLPTGAGSWFYGVKFAYESNIFLIIFAILLFIIFIFIAIGIWFNYLKLNILEKELKEIKNGIW